MPTLMLPANYTATHQFDVKRSQFIAQAHRATSVDDARDFIASVKEQYPDARHTCTAYTVLTPDSPNPILHSSDDGEPAGTAGRPMLDVLLGSGVSCTVVTVTRYFGGTLLGTGGLVRAYSDAVHGVLSDAQVVRIDTAHRVHVKLPHARAGKIEGDLRARGFAVINTEYFASSVDITCSVPDADRHSFDNFIAELTQGLALPAYDGLVSREIPVGTLSQFMA